MERRCGARIYLDRYGGIDRLGYGLYSLFHRCHLALSREGTSDEPTCFDTVVPQTLFSARGFIEPVDMA